MASSDLPPAVQQLVWRHLPSIDHVAILLALRAAAGDALAGTHEGGSHRRDELSAAYVAAQDTAQGSALEINEVAERTGVSDAVAAQVLADLHAAGLLERHVHSFVFSRMPDVREAVNQLAEMYNTRPVTLVRAMYDRPATSVQQFADAFRLRKHEDL